MDSKSRAPAWVLFLAASASAGLLIVAGCTLDKDGKGLGNTFNRVGGHSGELLEPKRCMLKVAILSRPYGDPAIHDAVWKTADEQIIPPKDRRAWEVNGLRIGRIIGELPPELEASLKDTTSQNKVIPSSFFVVSGESTVISVSQAVEQASLLMNRDNRIFGSDYKDVSGYFRVTARHEAANNVSLRVVPEFHHGPVQRTFQALPTAAPIGPQEFSINNGQQEETIRELATSMVLEPGQVAVIGCRPEQKGSLGTFFFTKSVAHSDQRLEKLILIWASRNLQGEGPNDRGSKTGERPSFLKRMLGTMPETAPVKPAAPAPEMPRTDSLPPDADLIPPATGPTQPPIQPATKPAEPKVPRPPAANEPAT
jgi:hypothetical protein